MDVAKPEGRGDISTSPSVHGSTGAPPLRVMMGGNDDSAPSSPPWPPSDAVSPVTQSQAFNLNTIDSTTECIQDRRLFRMRGLVMVSAAFHDVRLQSCQWMKALLDWPQ